VHVTSREYLGGYLTSCSCIFLIELIRLLPIKGTPLARNACKIAQVV